jgi:uncharacterized protein YkwD
MGVTWLRCSGMFALVYAVWGCGGDEVDAGRNPLGVAGRFAMSSAGAPARAGAPNVPKSAVAGSAGLAATGATGTANLAGTPAIPIKPPTMMTAGAPAPTMGAAGMPVAAAAGSGAPPAPGAGDASMCPAAPAGATAEAVQALMTVNMMRIKAGSGCMNMIPALNMSATNHCNYNATNRSDAMCMAGGHGEVMSCMGFTGADVAAREKAAGYSAAGATEVLTSYGNKPLQAVPSWVDTVWHRIPILDPWTTDMGWGGAMGCDIIDFGRGMSLAPNNTVVVYPYDGQTGVPPSFSGRESPVPPAPESGWPSSYPINVYAKSLSVTEHVLTKDGDPTPLPHVWMDSKSSTVDPGYRGYLASTAFMYGNAAFAPMTKYRVKIVGTSAAGPLNLEWTFTTGTAPRF